MAGSLKQLRGELKGAGVDVKNLARAESKIARQTAAVNKRLIHQAKASRARDMRRTAFSGGVLGIAAPVMALGAPIRAAVKYEEVMADVKKVTNLSSKEFQQLQTDILKMSTQIPMSAQGLGNIISAAGQSGIAKTRPELLSFAETAAKMGVAFDVSGAEAGKIMADWRSGMGLTQKQANELADQVNELSNNFNTSAGALAEIIQRQGAVAMAAGLTKEETAALGAAMKAGGAGTEIAATGLKNFTNALTKGRMHSESAQLAFEDMGLDAVKVAKGMQKDAQGTILSVISSIKKNVPAHEIAAVVGKIFGEESKGAIMPLIKNTKLLEDAFKIAGDRTKWSGSMLKEYEERYKTTANAIDLFKNRMNALSVTTGAIMLPTFNQMLGAVSGVSDRVFDLAKAHPEAAKKIVGGTAGLLGGIAGWKAAAAGTKWVAGGLGEIYHSLKKINAMQLFKNKKLLGLGAIGALAYAAHELGMLEPMAKGFSKEMRKGSKGLIEDINEAYKGWQEILGGTHIKDLENWEDVGRVIGEGAAKYLISFFESAFEIPKLFGGIAGSLSVGDFKGAKEQWDAYDRKMEEIRKKKGISSFEVSPEIQTLAEKTKHPFRNLSGLREEKSQEEDKEEDRYKKPQAGFIERKFSNKALKTYFKNMVSNEGLVNRWHAFDRWSHDLFSDAGSFWGEKYSDFIKRDRERSEKLLAQGVKFMSFMPPPPPEKKEVDLPKVDVGVYEDMLGKIEQVKKNIHDIFGDTGKTVEKWAGDIVGVFDDMIANIGHFKGDISSALEAAEERFKIFRSEMAAISVDIAGYFRSIGSSISGSITSELSAATSAANALVDAIKRIENAAARAREIKLGSLIPKESELQKPKFFDDFIEESNKFENNISGIFDITGKSAGRWAGDISTGLDETEGRFNDFNTDINAITNEISRDFSAIGSSISGSITSELNSATAAANQLATALDKVKTAPKLDPKKLVFDENQEKLFKGISASKKTYDQFAEHDMDFYSLQDSGKLYHKARASGGPIHPGESYLVGEKGPELIFPSRPGWVANNGITNEIFGKDVPGGFLNNSIAGGFLKSGVSGLFHFMNPFRGLQWGGLPGGSVSDGILEALLKQIKASRSERPARRRGAGIGTINFRPNITVHGSNPAEAEKQIYNAAEQGLEYLRKQIDALWNDERRLDYGS